MSAKTDPAAPDDSAASIPAASASPSTESSSAPWTITQRKPRVALFIATAAGLGYFPTAPGTLGSLVGVAIFGFFDYFAPLNFLPNPNHMLWGRALWVGTWMLPLTLLIAVAGVWASSQVEKRFGEKDPQYVVIDEVSGQHLTYVLALALGSWKYLLLGFILFRVLDIWKPFPARQAESLPGGWGIMADDWIAGIYAAIGLWLARAAGL
jgi:phosphatidylglycerophosphatase A